jgi:FKBP-type peptidyl-prolyl cis-trans isomerase SlyD
MDLAAAAKDNGAFLGGLERMNVAGNTVVNIHYRVLDEDGNEIMSSDAGQSVPVLMGMGGLLPGLEQALMGRQAGESFSATLPPEQAWGERQVGMIERVPLKYLQLPGGAKRPEPGMLVELDGEHGPVQAIVQKVGKFNADLDMNHPLAGQTVTFEVQVDAVRAATEEELSHGHVHDSDGCHH